MPPPIRYRFAGFVASPRRRALTRDGVEVPLIPRYFDLLLLLLERRHDAVHRQDIFTRVWSDVIVSDGALSQAVRTLRRTLGDDSREPAFIRTVARHGYRFVYPDVIEEPDEGPVPEPSSPAGPVEESGPDGDAQADPFEPLIDRIVGSGRDRESEEQRRDAAERLHGLGTDEALRRLGVRPGHERARALLRDTRWDVATAGEVPFVGQPGAARAMAALAGLRWQRAWRHAAMRWGAAATGAGGAGAVAGLLGGLILMMLPSSGAPASAAIVLGLIGAAAGAMGAAGVGAGLAVAEALARSQRAPALVAGGALGGALVALLGHLLVRWTLGGLFGLHDVAIAGAPDGLVVGAASGGGYALATERLSGGGMAAPTGYGRLRTAGVVALACGIAAFALAAGGRPLVGGMVNDVAQVSRGANLALAPFGRLIGEPGFGLLTGALLGACEGAFFGFGLAIGLTRRPRQQESGASH